MQAADVSLSPDSRVKGLVTDFIERLFGLAPDGGNGFAETCVLIAIALVLFLAGRSRPVVSVATGTPPSRTVAGRLARRGSPVGREAVPAGGLARNG
jgi:hypothetical protein